MSINWGGSNVRPSDDGRREGHLGVALRGFDGLHACPIEVIVRGQEFISRVHEQPRKRPTTLEGKV